MKIKNKLIRLLGGIPKLEHEAKMNIIREQRDSRERELKILCKNPTHPEVMRIINFYRAI